MKNIVVSDIMTREPLTVRPSTNLLECAKQMVKKRLNSLPITNKKKLVGFISQRDILWAMVKKSKKDLTHIKAISISPKKIAILKPSASIEEAISKIKKYKFYKYPVTKNNGELVGIITIRDILNFYPQLQPEFRELELIREEKEKLKRLKTGAKKIKNICEKCGKNDYLYKFNGMLLCETCMNSM